MRGRAASTGLLAALVPHERRVFELLDAQAGAVRTAGEQLELLVHHWPNRRDLLDLLAVSRREGDEAGEAIFTHVHATFVTALDREDLLELSDAMRGYVMHAERAADLLSAYKVRRAREPARRLTHVTAQGSDELATVVGRLGCRRGDSVSTEVLRRLEHEAESLLREAMRDLLADEPETAELLAWRDVYRGIEQVVAALSSAARAMRAIELKR